MLEFLLCLYILSCLFVAAIGSGRTIGAGSVFLLSLILSPVVGLIICLLYPSVEAQRKRYREASGLSIADEIEKLKKLYKDGNLTVKEYEREKRKLLK